MTVRRDLDALAAAGPAREGARRRDAARRPERRGAGLRGEVAPPARRRRRRSRARPRGSSSRARRSGSPPARRPGGSRTTSPQVPDLTVVTNSIQVANVLHREPRPDLTVVLTGGVRTPSDALVGPIAVDRDPLAAPRRALHGRARRHRRRRRSRRRTCSRRRPNRALVAASARLVVVADHTKWGVRGLSRIAGLDEVDVFVSDQGLDADARAAIGEHVERHRDRADRARRSPGAA